MGNRGFTIVELIVVGAILAVLTLMAFPAYDKIKDRVRTARAMEEIRGIEKVIAAWTIDRGGSLPANLAALGQPPAFSIDPWGNPYEYHPKTPAGVPVEAGYTARFGIFGGDMSPMNTDYDLFTLGRDGVSAADITDPRCKDDVLRVNEGSWVGEVSKLTEGL